MHAVAPECQTTASISPHDMREVDKVMLDVIERSEDSRAHSIMVSSANCAAIYHLKSGGQRIRARLALHSARCLNLTKKDGIVLAATAELIHNASLIHDDLQDRDEIRRNVAAVWFIHGDDVAICAGDLLLSAAYSTIADVSCIDKLPRLIKLVHSRVVRAISGQCADLSCASAESLDVDEYLKITTAKSGSLLGLPMELALLAADCSSALDATRSTVNSFAAGYQIFDDLCDLEADLARGVAAPALNVVQVLQRNNAMTSHQAWESAKKLGLKHLQVAATDSADLPLQSGRLLQELAMDLMAQLKGKCIQ